MPKVISLEIPDQELSEIVALEFAGWRIRTATHESPVEQGGMRLPNYFDKRSGVPAWTHKDHPGVYSIPPRFAESLDQVFPLISSSKSSFTFYAEQYAHGIKSLDPRPINYCSIFVNHKSDSGRAIVTTHTGQSHLSMARAMCFALLKTKGFEVP